MEGISEKFNTKSLTISSLFAFEMIFNSTTCDCISRLLSCFIFSISCNSFLSFSSFVFLRLSSLAFLLPLLFSSLLSLFPLVLFEHKASQILLFLSFFQTLEAFDV